MALFAVRPGEVVSTEFAAIAVRSSHGLFYDMNEFNCFTRETSNSLALGSEIKLVIASYEQHFLILGSAGHMALVPKKFVLMKKRW